MQRVCAYCRVSTDKEEQANSLESQKLYFAEYIQRNTLWELGTVYVDEGTSGTDAKKRHAFQQMIADAQNGKFDLLLTKEISRFARNTLDSIYYTRKLKEWGVGVIFLRDNINTLDPDAELRLTIMSSIAQEESRKTSDRVKWGQKRRMEQGVVFGRSLLGYDVKDGCLQMNEEGAEVVRLIFHKFAVEGKGTHRIARELCEADIATGLSIQHWSKTAVLRILRNEKYAGDLVQKKSITPNYLNHAKKRNQGEEAFVTLHGHHPPIIARSLFEQVQAELKRRAPNAEQCSRYSNRYCFSGKLQCGFCGAHFVTRTKKRKDDSLYRAWRCAQAALHGRPRTDANGQKTGCEGRQLGHEALLQMLAQAVARLPLAKEAIVAHLTEVMQLAIAAEQQSDTAKQIQVHICQTEGKRRRLIVLLLENRIEQADFEALTARYTQELKHLKQKLAASIQAEQSGKKEEEMAILATSIRSMLNGNLCDEVFLGEMLEKIVIYDRTHLEVKLQHLPEVLHCALPLP